jgi:hypothetical protein
MRRQSENGLAVALVILSSSISPLTVPSLTEVRVAVNGYGSYSLDFPERFFSWPTAEAPRIKFSQFYFDSVGIECETEANTPGHWLNSPCESISLEAYK